MLTQYDVCLHLDLSDAELYRTFVSCRYEGKYLVASDGSKAVLCLGSSEKNHSDILQKATNELFGESWVTSSDPVSTKPLSGFTIGGGKYRIVPITGEVELFDSSASFGSLKDGVFDEQTREIVIREIEAIKVSNDQNFHG